MGRIYSCSFTGTLANAGGNADLLEALAADDKPIKLRGFKIGQISEVGDATEEGISITIKRFTATVTSGSGGSTITPSPMDSADTAAGFACEMNNATIATTSGSSVVMEELAWNIRSSPFETYWPDWAIKAKQGEGLLITCNTTVADDVTVSITVYIEEE